ncbi:MAG: helix-turn-helix domain-containing protein [Candidatus Lokiarchaeota archaeon]
MTDKIIQRINKLLIESGYQTFVFDSESQRALFCFDLIVKKDDLVFIVKIFSNIDNIDNEMIEGLKTLSSLLKSKPLLIGKKNRYQTLEKNTIYIRNGLPFITIETLENIIQQDLYPYILARRGGNVIFLDGELMRALREKKKISRKELSEKLGVARRTVCSYESGNMRPSQEMAERISNILGSESLFRNINVFEWHFDVNFQEIDTELDLTPFQEHLKDVIEDIGIRGFFYRHGYMPFDLSLISKSQKTEPFEGIYPVLSGISEEIKRITIKKLQSLCNFTQLFHRKGLFIVENDFKLPDNLDSQNIPFVKIKILEKIDDETEFINFIKEK